MSKNKFYIFALLMMLPLISCSNKPKGDELKTQFFEHKTEITELLKMQLEDSKVVRIVPTFTRLETSWAWPRKDIGFSEKRWNQYRALFQVAKIQAGLQKEEANIFYLVKGYRGFVYMTKPPKHIELIYDDCKLKDKNDTCFVFLEKNWYLFKGLIFQKRECICQIQF